MYGKIQKLRFVAMGTSMVFAALVFILGAVWIKYLYNGIDKGHLEDAGREIRSRIMVQRQFVLADMAQFQLPQYSDVLMKAGGLKEKSPGEIIPENFEFAAYYDIARKFVIAAKRDGKARTQVPLSADVMNMAVVEGAALFDVASSEGQSSGILLLEGKPWLMGLRVLKVRDNSVGFAVAGRRLEPRRLALTAGLSEQVVEVFVPDPKVSFPSDVEAAKNAMVGDSNSFMRLDRRGVGTGYLRFDDVFERTAFILRFEWSDIGPASERSTLAWLFVCAMIFGGIIHAASSGALTWFALQKRHTPGLSGLSDHELRSTIESFPGYAFALAGDGTYVGMSRSLSGVFGKEPSDFHGKAFGEAAGERGMLPGLVREKLLDSKQWPAEESIEIMVQGLEKEHKFSGSAYLIPNKRVSLCIVKAKKDEHAVAVPFEEFQKMQRSGAAEVMAGIAEELTDTIVDAEQTSEEILAHIANLPAGDKSVLSSLTLRLKSATRRIHQVLLSAANRTVGAAHDLEPAKSEVAMHLVQSAIYDVSTYAAAMGVPIELQAHDLDLKLTCKRRPFVQALCHLMANGVDAVSGTETPWVRVQFIRKGDNLEVSVTDSGRGLSADAHDKAFRPFYSTKESNAKRPHLGLGLSIVQGFAESHSGELVCDRESAHTRFVMTLPLNPPSLEQFIRTRSAA